MLARSGVTPALASLLVLSLFEKSNPAAPEAIFSVSGRVGRKFLEGCLVHPHATLLRLAAIDC